jgi:hypothetical protein
MTPPHFYIFVIISPLKRTWSFIWTNLNSLHPRIICTKFDWIWPAGSGEEDFLKNFSAFLLFRYYLPLEKGDPLHLNTLESPPPKDDLCQVWLKLALWFWRSRKCKGQTDDGQTAIRIAHLSFQLRWANKKGRYLLDNTFQTKLTQDHYVKVKVTQIIPYM